jgi:predicted nuclease of predicted toxin-antitoxin system
VAVRLILDDMLPHALADELRARGREARTVAELGLAGATDAEVAALDGVLVTTVAIDGATCALVRGNAREAVHRHAHAMAALRPGSHKRFLG